MKLWFAKKGNKSPYDATVEQTLRFAQEVGSATEQTAATDLTEFAALLREPAAPVAISTAASTSSSLIGKPTVSRAMREEVGQRVASYRAFQMKLNEDREARMRKTMAEMRVRLQSMATPDRPSAP